MNHNYSHKKQNNGELSQK